MPLAAAHCRLDLGALAVDFFKDQAHRVEPACGTVLAGSAY
jgi:hypothetical protein